MDNNYLEKCSVTRWFWLRACILITLFTGLSLFFLYDWKVGYPEKNYKLTQYHTFEKARDYFVKHVQMGRSKEQWTKFAQQQELAYFSHREIVEPYRQHEEWPSILTNYRSYSSTKKAGESPRGWDEFISSQSKGDLDWTAPLPSEFIKGEYDENYRLLIYRTFQKAEELFAEYGAQGEAQWEFITSCQDLAFEQDRMIVPEQYRDELWPPILSDYDAFYALAKEDIEQGLEINEPYLWKEYTSEMKWSQTPPKEMMKGYKIDEQLYFGVGGLLVALIGAIYALRMKPRYMAVDQEAYYAPGGKKILFTAIHKIDKRKWETKGLATLFFKEGNETKKAKVDGMVYGQFDKEQGEPAQKLFDVIMANFKGELIEFVAEDTEQG